MDNVRFSRPIPSNSAIKPGCEFLLFRSKSQAQEVRLIILPIILLPQVYRGHVTFVKLRHRNVLQRLSSKKLGISPCQEGALGLILRSRTEIGLVKPVKASGEGTRRNPCVTRTIGSRTIWCRCDRAHNTT